MQWGFVSSIRISENEEKLSLTKKDNKTKSLNPKTDYLKLS
jgi:hypothetical protein